MFGTTPCEDRSSSGEENFVKDVRGEVFGGLYVSSALQNKPIDRVKVKPVQFGKRLFIRAGASGQGIVRGVVNHKGF